MFTIHVLLYAIAAVCFLLAAIGVATSRVNLIALGLLAWVLVYLVDTIHAG